MRELNVAEVAGAVRRLCVEANYRLPEDVETAVRLRAEKEPWAPAAGVLSVICENIDAASERRFPLCQDTGMMTVWIEAGQEVRFTG